MKKRFSSVRIIIRLITDNADEARKRGAGKGQVCSKSAIMKWEILNPPRARALFLESSIITREHQAAINISC